MLRVDGLSNMQKSGVGIALTLLEGDKVQYCLRFLFKALNNEVEYEALIA